MQKDQRKRTMGAVTLDLDFYRLALHYSGFIIILLYLILGSVQWSSHPQSEIRHCSSNTFKGTLPFRRLSSDWLPVNSRWAGLLCQK